MSSTNEHIIRRVFAEVVNQGKFELIEELYAPDVVDHDPFPGAPRGRDGVRFTLTRLREMYPDLYVDINRLVADGNLVTLLNTWSGTFTGRRMGRTKSPRRIEFTGIVVFRLEDGQVAERWASLDIAGMLRQLQVNADDVRRAGVTLDGVELETSALRALGEVLRS